MLKTNLTKLTILLILSLALFTNCAVDGTEPGGGAGSSNSGNNTKLSFSITDAEYLFVGPETAGRGRAGSTDKILFKKTKSGNIEPAVSGTSGQFKINYMLKNPVKDEILLLGTFDVNENGGSNSFYLIRVDSDNNYHGLSTPDDYAYFDTSAFDDSGAFYYKTTSSTPGEPARLWKYHNGVATPIVQGNDGVTLNLKRVMGNGYLIYSDKRGDVFTEYLRNPDGGISVWSSSYSGVYSAYSDTYYYSMFNYGTIISAYRFDTKEEFEAGETIAGSSNVLENSGNTIITVDRSSTIRKYLIGADKKLTSEVILSGYSINSVNVEGYKEVLLLKKKGSNYYFAGKTGAEDENIIKYDSSTGAVTKLLNAADASDFLINNVSFDDFGNLTAVVQKMSNGKYGTIEGNLELGIYSFTERAGFDSVSDVMLF